MFALVTSTETRNQIKAPNFGINWTHGQKSVEVVNSLTGKTINNKISRLTKQTFFVRYANLTAQLPDIPITRRTITADYRESKLSVRDYQIAKRELFDAFRREDLGNWLKKPMEQDEFHLPKELDLDIDMGIEPVNIKMDHIQAMNSRSSVSNHRAIKSKTLMHKRKKYDKAMNRFAGQNEHIGKIRNFGFVTFNE